MHRWIVTIAIVTALGLTVWGGFGLNAHLIAALDAWGGGAATLTKINTTLDTVNRPCGSGHPCGTLANADKAMVKVGDILVTSQRQEKDVAVAAESNMAAVNQLAGHLDKTADALTETAQGASVALGTANSSIAALLPLESAYTATGQDLDAVIRENSPSLHASLVNVAGMTDNGNGVLVDLRKMSDKAEHDLDAAKPWWERGLAAGNDLVRAGCLITGRCP
jgi:hypothetical protein